MPDLSFLEHVALALVVQAVVGLLSRNWWAGAAVASAYFVGREFAQAEYRWIETYGEGLRANMPWWGPFDVSVWPKLDQWLDWIAPVVVTCTVAWFVGRRNRC
ncbi:hypothetical protein ABVV53_09290 [Novosphingobium sp. RD2P27]|uniref:Uncharacterized protein n=1 Tax=Novosphingobium kalidii TaxID=3230299 RepID=A0ABV2D1C9_9SPHN